MSILDVFVKPDIALVGFDSLATREDGVEATANKIVILPGIDAVVAFRGLNMILMTVSPLLVGFSGGFDELAEIMPEYISIAVAHSGRVCGPDAELGNHFVLVGFSPLAGEVVCHSFERKPQSEEIEVIQRVPQVIAPFPGREEIRSLEIKADLSGMVELAKQQVAYVQRKQLGVSVGGKFYVAQVCRDHVRIDLACILM